MKKEEMVSLFYLLNKHESISLSNGERKAHLVREFVASLMNNSEKVIIDLENIRSVSPSFSYIAFGKLVDQFGPSAKAKISFINDERLQSKKIVAALERRANVLSSEKS